MSLSKILEGELLHVYSQTDFQYYPQNSQLDLDLEALNHAFNPSLTKEANLETLHEEVLKEQIFTSLINTSHISNFENDLFK